MLSDFYHKNANDTIWWVRSGEIVDGHWINDSGPLLFSFDKKTVFNIWEDYPQRLTPEEKEIFDRENPFWVKFFSSST